MHGNGVTNITLSPSMTLRLVATRRQHLTPCKCHQHADNNEKVKSHSDTEILTYNFVVKRKVLTY